jgi:hypothetical protein
MIQMPSVREDRKKSFAEILEEEQNKNYNKYQYQKELKENKGVVKLGTVKGRSPKRVKPTKRDIAS